MKLGKFGAWYHRATWNNFPVHDWRVVWMLMPKTASTAVRHALAQQLGLPTHEVHELMEFDGMSTDHVRSLQSQGYLVIGSIRHPVLRLASCWSDKTHADRYYTEFTVYDEFWPGMPFVDFVDAVSGIPDEDAEPHFRSMSFDLVRDGVVVPDLLLEQSTLASDWNRARAHVAWRTSPHVWLPDLAVRHSSSWRDRIGEVPRRTLAAIHERYAADFAAFGYPDDLDFSTALLRSRSRTPSVIPSRPTTAS